MLALAHIIFILTGWARPYIKLKDFTYLEGLSFKPPYSCSFLKKDSEATLYVLKAQDDKTKQTPLETKPKTPARFRVRPALAARYILLKLTLKF